jgi:uncharacterized OB-fold protein
VTTTERVPVVADLFRATDDGIALVGTRCPACGTTSFPRAPSCRNPECPETVVAETLFGRTGELFSYTVQNYRPPPLFRLDPFEPYAIGLVAVPEGLRVMAMLTGCALDELRIGMPLELTVRTLTTDETGREVLTHAYRPRDGEDPR